MGLLRQNQADTNTMNHLKDVNGIIDIMKQLICYCFEYSEDDIITDFETNNGKSSILERIIEARRNNTCQCDDKHPEKK